MNNFLRAYNFTLIYVAGLSILGFIGYYSMDFPLEKATKIGTLYGFMVGVVVNIIPAFLVMLRLNKELETPQVEPKKAKQPLKKEHTNVPNNTLSISAIKEMYLLLDKEMAFDLSIESITQQSIGSLLSSNKHRGAFSVRTEHQTIDFEVQPLTRHTSKLNIKAQKQNDTFNDILTYIKNKEASVLTY